jgi:hypothetical protein
MNVDYLESNPMTSDEIPEIGPWPWLINDHGKPIKIFNVMGFPLKKPIVLKDGEQWFAGCGGVQWIHDAAAKIIKYIKDNKLLPEQAVEVEEKYLTKWTPRNVHIASRFESDIIGLINER